MIKQKGFSDKEQLLRQIKWCVKINDPSLLLIAINEYGKKQMAFGFFNGWSKRGDHDSEEKNIHADGNE